MTEEMLKLARGWLTKWTPEVLIDAELDESCIAEDALATLLTDEIRKARESALEEAAKHQPTVWRRSSGYFVVCECGEKFPCNADDDEPGFALWKQHLRSLGGTTK